MPIQLQAQMRLHNDTVAKRQDRLCSSFPAFGNRNSTKSCDKSDSRCLLASHASCVLIHATSLHWSNSLTQIEHELLSYILHDKLRINFWQSVSSAHPPPKCMHKRKAARLVCVHLCIISSSEPVKVEFISLICLYISVD